MQEAKNFDIETGEGQASQIQLNLHHWDKAQGRLKGLMWAGPILFGGLLTIFIPIVHFVSVPASLIIAPVVYLTVSKLFASGTSYRGSTTCPSCKNQVQISGSTEDFPTYTNCPSCRTALKLTPSST